MRSATEVTYKKIAKIVYTVSESVANGVYPAIIKDLSFSFANGSSITQAEIPVTLKVDHSFSGIPVIESAVEVHQVFDYLEVISSANETISIYSIDSKLLYRTTKQAGKIQIPLNRIHTRILIVKGGSGWVRKVM